jgi:hypothetical protein
MEGRIARLEATVEQLVQTLVLLIDHPQDSTNTERLEQIRQSLQKLIH